MVMILESGMIWISQIRHQIGQPFGPSPSLSKKSLIDHAFSNDNPRYFGNSRSILQSAGQCPGCASWQFSAPLCSARRICLLQPCLTSSGVFSAGSAVCTYSAVKLAPNARAICAAVRINTQKGHLLLYNYVTPQNIRKKVSLMKN